MKVHRIPLKYPIDTGAPTPKILSSENFLLLFYFVEERLKTVNKRIIQRDVVSDRGVVTMKFENYLNFKFGTPNDEVIHGHPYYQLGLRSYSFFEICNSDWIAQIIEINSVHPRHSEELFTSYRHFVLTFHDSMFECIASDYQVSFSTRSMGEIISENIESLILTD